MWSIENRIVPTKLFLVTNFPTYVIYIMGNGMIKDFCCVYTNNMYLPTMYVTLRINPLHYFHRGDTGQLRLGILFVGKTVASEFATLH